MQYIFLSLLLLITSYIHSASRLDPFNFDDTYSPVEDHGTLPGIPEKCLWDSPPASPQIQPASSTIPAHLIPLIIPSLPASAQMTIDTNSDYFLEQALHFLNSRFLQENPIPPTPCQPITPKVVTAPTPGIAQLPVHKSPIPKKKSTRIKNPQTPPPSPQSKSKEHEQPRYACIENRRCTYSSPSYTGLKAHCSTYHQNKKLKDSIICTTCSSGRKNPRSYHYKSLEHNGKCEFINSELDAINARDAQKKRDKKAALALLISQQMKLDAQAPK